MKSFFQIDEMISKEKAKYGKQFWRLLNRLKNPEELEVERPDSLQAELRDYQNYGFQWLKTLHYYHQKLFITRDQLLPEFMSGETHVLLED
ncbi:hypothetical protein P9E76_19590 [Schinkia azotoformans]|uniref:SNF2 helicase family protein n=1 Tax=Schinkia azotoformans LMG 9581 TaxID=1131731 RepID=K6BVF2_SCHAZ|nr:hypothetical protein [Schinkia azotoformans]EKN62910.1 SNF2 helicase family protein [Schinkia azotoformans LMG 9581]MEC1639814.1 hypothetical protein [Schinkia azotoformans]MEC1719800.1 hypothetical protein [Schinkia azotoformans]MEC1947211.1 hypothetical protein [Schinkia azotoformans]MED4354613.1 hypothetical protein [Schinkia azotoformans]